jgi:hypothetical protein
MKSNAVVIESPKTDSRIFAHTRWDAIPVLAAFKMIVGPDFG